MTRPFTRSMNTFKVEEMDPRRSIQAVEQSFLDVARARESFSINVLSRLSRFFFYFFFLIFHTDLGKRAEDIAACTFNLMLVCRVHLVCLHAAFNRLVLRLESNCILSRDPEKKTKGAKADPHWITFYSPSLKLFFVHQELNHMQFI
jgi:hypothetical protein